MKELKADKPAPTPDYTIETTKLDDNEGAEKKTEAAVQQSAPASKAAIVQKDLKK